MGNLINPNLLRLNNNITWKSSWVSYQNHNYSYLLSHDYLLMSYINWILRQSYFTEFGWVLYFSHYKVLRYNNLFIIIFFFKDYNLKVFFSKFLKKFRKKQMYNNNNKFNKFKNNSKVNNKSRKFIKSKVKNNVKQNKNLFKKNNLGKNKEVNLNKNIKDNNKSKVGNNNFINNNFFSKVSYQVNRVKTIYSLFLKFNKKYDLELTKGNIFIIKKVLKLKSLKLYIVNLLLNELKSNNKDVNITDVTKTFYILIGFIFTKILKIKNTNIFLKLKLFKNAPAISIWEFYNFINISFLMLKKIMLNNKLRIKFIKKTFFIKKLKEEIFIEEAKVSDDKKNNLKINLLVDKLKTNKSPYLTTDILLEEYRSLLLTSRPKSKFLRKKLNKDYRMVTYYLTSSHSEKKLPFFNKILRKKILLLYNSNILYRYGQRGYKRFAFNRYNKVSIGLIKDFYNLNLAFRDYNYNLARLNSNNSVFQESNTYLKASKYKYNHNILNLIKSSNIDYITKRLKVYNFLIITTVKYIFLIYKKVFFKFSGLLRVNYLSNCVMYIYLLKKNYITSTLVTNYISRNLKIGHSLNKIVYPLLKFLYEDNKSLYLGWKIGGFGRFQRRGRARKQWFIRGNVPLSTLISDVDYHSQVVQLRNGICNIKVFIVRRKKFHYNI